MYDKILVPVDGSETSNNGLDQAIQIAKTMHSQLHLVHIVNELIFDYSYSPGLYATNVIESMRERGKTIMDEAEAAARKHGLQPESVLLEAIGGPAADLIVEEARDSRADLIVMGTHGRRGLRRLVLGSDAENVVRRADIPVLLVHGPARTHALPIGNVRERTATNLMA